MEIPFFDRITGLPWRELIVIYYYHCFIMDQSC